MLSLTLHSANYSMHGSLTSNATCCKHRHEAPGFRDKGEKRHEMHMLHAVVHLTPPRLTSKQCSLTDILGDVLVMDNEGSMRRKSLG